MMRLLIICIAVTLVAAKPPSSSAINYKSLNGELDSILAMSKNINNMTPEELIQLSARVDGTLKKLELFAEKRLGLSKDDIDQINQAIAAPKVKRQLPGGAEAAGGSPALGGLGALGGGGGEGMGGLLSLFTSMFSGILPALQQIRPGNNPEAGPAGARAIETEKAAPAAAHIHETEKAAPAVAHIHKH